MTKLLQDDALPSIRNRALLVSVSFSKPQMTKLDAKATRDAETANGANGAIRAQKLLYPKRLLDPITSLEAEVYNYLRSKTLRFGDSGMYLLDTTKFMEVADQLEKHKLERSQLVTVFAQNWANVLDEAQKQQGALFDPSVYPDVSDVAGQFTTKITYLPVGDLAPNLFDHVETEIKSEIERRVSETTNALVVDAVRQPIERMIEAVINVYDKTSRDGARIHESLMGRLQDVVEAMPALNVLNIPELDELARYARDKLLVSTDMLKSGKKGDTTQVRRDVADAAEKLLKPMGIDPAGTQNLTEKERRDLAATAADNIMAAMRGFA